MGRMTNHEKNTEHLKMVAYCRVSTENQKEEGTVELQIDAIKRFCEENGHELVSIFKDEGISGGLEHRPALAELFGFLESNEGKGVQAVIIWKLDRIARDLYIQEHLIKKIEGLGKKLISTKEADIDSHDPMRKSFRQFLGVVAELEKAFITMRLSAGRMKKARNGRYSGGGVALGYASKNKDLQLVKEEADIVKMIFHLRRYKRLPLNKIAKHLNEKGIPTKRGGLWHSGTVAYILENRLYRGFYQYKGEKVKRIDLAVL